MNDGHFKHDVGLEARQEPTDFFMESDDDNVLRRSTSQCFCERYRHWPIVILFILEWYFVYWLIRWKTSNWWFSTRLSDPIIKPFEICEHFSVLFEAMGFERNAFFDSSVKFSCGELCRCCHRQLSKAFSLDSCNFCDFSRKINWHC